MKNTWTVVLAFTFITCVQPAFSEGGDLFDKGTAQDLDQTVRDLKEKGNGEAVSEVGEIKVVGNGNVIGNGNVLVRTEKGSDVLLHQLAKAVDQVTSSARSVIKTFNEMKGMHCKDWLGQAMKRCERAVEETIISLENHTMDLEPLEKVTDRIFRLGQYVQMGNVERDIVKSYYMKFFKTAIRRFDLELPSNWKNQSLLRRCKGATNQWLLTEEAIIKTVKGADGGKFIKELASLEQQGRF